MKYEIVQLTAELKLEYLSKDKHTQLVDVSNAQVGSYIIRDTETHQLVGHEKTKHDAYYSLYKLSLGIYGDQRLSYNHFFILYNIFSDLSKDKDSE